MTHAEWQEKFIIKRQGKDFVLYAGLLHSAHEEGLVSIITKLVQIPDEKNGRTAICTATVTLQVGDRTCIYTGIGDAAPNNVAPAMQNCLIRFAETRAKARALRDATNIGVTAFEELGSEDNETPAAPTQRRNAPAPQPANGVQRPAPTSRPDLKMESVAANLAGQCSECFAPAGASHTKQCSKSNAQNSLMETAEPSNLTAFGIGG